MRPTKQEMFKVLSEYYHVSLDVIYAWMEDVKKEDKERENWLDHDL